VSLILAVWRKGVSRTARLLELLIRVQTRPRFTAQELAEEFGVSRRTVLRDLSALSEMGVPLRSTPGPGGGYALPRGGRRLSPSLTVDEALGAALNGVHLKAVYDSIRSAVSERVIYPFGVYASQGFWYCFCYDYMREANVSLRADRIRAVEHVEGFERPPHVPSSEWVRPFESGGDEMIQVRAYTSERGTKSFELESLFGKIGRDSDGRGVISVKVPRSEIDFICDPLAERGDGGEGGVAARAGGTGAPEGRTDRRTLQPGFQLPGPRNY
jgi:predicted DNA-binding transcriptional regulator YafY